MIMNNKPSSKNVLKAIIISSCMIVQPLAYASVTPVPAIMDISNNKLIADMEDNINKGHELAAEDCANPDTPGSLASRQVEVMQEKKTLATKSMDMGKFFEIGKNNGCFAALTEFPDLSISIPSLADVLAKLQKTLADYAVRKVCNAVNEAFEEAIGPITEKLDKLSSSGQLDLNGRVNKALTKKMYEIDPEMGRVSTSAPSGAEVEFTW